MDKLNYLQFAYVGLVLDLSQFFLLLQPTQKDDCLKKSGHKNLGNNNLAFIV